MEGGAHGIRDDGHLIGRHGLIDRTEIIGRYCHVFRKTAVDFKSNALQIHAQIFFSTGALITHMARHINIDNTHVPY